MEVTMTIGCFVESKKLYVSVNQRVIVNNINNNKQTSSMDFQ